MLRFVGDGVVVPGEQMTVTAFVVVDQGFEFAADVLEVGGFSISKAAGCLGRPYRASKRALDALGRVPPG